MAEDEEYSIQGTQALSSQLLQVDSSNLQVLRRTQFAHMQQTQNFLRLDVVNPPSSHTSGQVPPQASTSKTDYGFMAASACVPVREIIYNLPIDSAAFAAGEEYEIMRGSWCKVTRIIKEYSNYMCQCASRER